MQVRYQTNAHTGLILWAFLFVLFFYSIATDAQVLTEDQSVETYDRTDGTFIGYSISVGSQTYAISSDLSKLHGIRLRREGGTVGFVLGNNYGAIKPTVGLFYSAPSAAYSIDALEVGLAGYLYFLRSATGKNRAFEPYLSLATKEVRSTFYGHFLDSHSGKNKSVSRDELFGRLKSMQGFVGLGVEYQLRSLENHFLHFFAEARYGMTMNESASTAVLRRTRTDDATSFTVGVNFGKIRSKRI